MVTSALKNVVVIGGSYVGLSAAQQLASTLPVTHRVILVEPHSHFHHLFAFPRYAVLPGHEHKAFIPYRPYAGVEDAERHRVVRARAVSLHPHHVVLDRPWGDSKELEFEYIAVATGTRLTPPGTMPSDDKAGGIECLQVEQNKVAGADDIVIIGGGAVGVQMATDLKELYPAKNVTLIQSRDRVMPKFHAAFHEIIAKRFDELGVKMITGSRVVIPHGGWPKDGKFDVVLKDGTTVPADLVIQATGQIPNNDIVKTLPEGEDLINPDNGFIRVLPTLQFANPSYPHMFAVGDIADTGAPKAARPGLAQATVLAKNVVSLIHGKPATETIEISPAGIHLTLGLVKNIVFRNPGAGGPGDAEPTIMWRDDGQADMGIEGVWARRGVKVNHEDDYRL